MHNSGPVESSDDTKAVAWWRFSAGIRTHTNKRENAKGQTDEQVKRRTAEL